MFDNSVIKKTGQMWKATLSFLTLISGGALVSYGYSHGILSPLIAIGMIVIIGSCLRNSHFVPRCVP